VSLNRAEKNQQIEAIRERFSRATSAVLVDYKGLDVESATELRTQFRKAGVDYRVVKNTLFKLALKGTKLEGNQKLTGYLVRSTGVAWCYEDPSAAAKIIKRFREDEKRAEKLAVKCGVLETVVISGERVESELATMPGKDEARAMLLAQLNAPAQSLLRQLNAAGQNLAFALDARKRQLESKA
jgi:large subunit ribosomal protein L10